MLPDWVLNPGPLTYESGVLPTALHGLASLNAKHILIISASGGSSYPVRETKRSNNVWCFIYLLVFNVTSWHYTILYIDYSKGMYVFSNT